MHHLNIFYSNKNGICLNKDLQHFYMKNFMMYHQNFFLLIHYEVPYENK
jgi:hypothetical protein